MKGTSTAKQMLVMKARVALQKAYRVPSGEISKLGNEVREIKDQLALLLAAAGTGKVEEVKRVERIKALRAAEVKEDKRKMEEKRKVAKVVKEAEGERKVSEKKNKKALELTARVRVMMEKEEAVVREC